MFASLSGSSLGERIPPTVPSCANKRLAFTAAVDDPDRFQRSRDIGAYLGFVPHRHQSGNFDYKGELEVLRSDDSRFPIQTCNRVITPPTHISS